MAFFTEWVTTWRGVLTDENAVKAKKYVAKALRDAVLSGAPRVSCPYRQILLFSDRENDPRSSCTGCFAYAHSVKRIIVGANHGITGTS